MLADMEMSIVLIGSLILVMGAGLKIFSKITGFPHTIAMLLAGLVVGIFAMEVGSPSEFASMLIATGDNALVTPHLIILFSCLPCFLNLLLEWIRITSENT